jgi:hypothetical protein
MRGRVVGRRAVMVILAGAASAIGASSAVAQTSPLPNGLGDGSAVNRVLDDAKQQLDRLGSKAPASRSPDSKAGADHSSGSGTSGSPSAGPARPHSGAAVAAPSGARSTRSVGTGTVQASSSGGAERSGPSSSASKARSAAKSAAGATPAADPTTAPEAASRTAAVVDNSGDGHSLPFTGSRPLQGLALGLLMGLMGLAARWALRGRAPLAARRSSG